MVEDELYLQELTAEEVPEFIKKQIDSLTELKQKIEDATIKADEAKEQADDQKSIERRIGWKGKAISGLQDTVSDLSEAQILFAEAHKLSYEFQERLAKLSRFMLTLGIQNTALNRSIIKTIEEHLGKTSREKLDERTRAELLNVLRELKAQEDLQSRQERMTTQIRTQKSLIDEQEKKDLEHDKKLAEGLERDRVHDSQIVWLQDRIAYQDRRIAELEVRLFGVSGGDPLLSGGQRVPNGGKNKVKVRMSVPVALLVASVVLLFINILFLCILFMP